jgi:hypothetical protein
VATDAWSSYPSALAGYRHDQLNVSKSDKPAHESLPAVHRLFTLVKRFVEGTYQGSGAAEHLQEYLDEFIFRFNRRASRYRGLVFLRLLQRAVGTGPVPYRDLVRVGRPKTVPAKGVAGPRVQPGSLEIVAVDRPWRGPR